MAKEAKTENDATDSSSVGSSIQVLLVDNDKDHARAMTESLERIGLDCTTATAGPDGAKLLAENIYDIVVTDLMMNDVDGMAILRQAKETQPECEVVMVTGHASVPLAVEAMKEGAFNFLEKPITPKRLQAIVSKATESIRLKRQNQQLHQRLDERFGFENLIYASDSMKGVVQRLQRIAPTDAGVLITGETGSGKDVIAQAIHQNSPRKKKPYVAINTAAVAEHLVESELFGHVKGAFTDAISDREGKFEYANGGTLFLDEVGDMPMATQIKLLRVLEEREITRVGDNKSIPVNVRVLAATNKDLEKEIDEGRFRSDLYFRLKVVTVHLDPLSKRREDILPLADFFRKQANKKNGRNVKGFSQDLRRWLLDEPWKGNVRQLKNVVESLVVMDLDDYLDMDDLSPDLLDEKTAAALSKKSGENANPSTAELLESDPGDDLASSSLVGKSLKEIERWAIEHTLTLANHNREETARILGISERNLYRKLNDYGLR
ncbi:sigma-54-dependent transcriptional regulator [Mariniblastus fucicola]|uniref:DNA-binding transcriptional response regulator n=1 Tax=Mariniblastus fucicola TaxID=980251 RepID=A0A5B9PHY7_9BACT|nr:sigma-54 dependent transcriptional regulator [Mariniblastus fucicola]QEG24286.1 DNA-binding transcriptional response regulator [Mariniblastus fucicola]